MSGSVTHFRYEFSSELDDDFLGCIEIGVVLAWIGSIGWAAFLKRKECLRLAILALLLPWPAHLLDFYLEDFKIHGPPALLVLLVIPGTLLAVIVGIMAAVKKV